jgi:hypothetical protein
MQVLRAVVSLQLNQPLPRTVVAGRPLDPQPEIDLLDAAGQIARSGATVCMAQHSVKAFQITRLNQCNYLSQLIHIEPSSHDTRLLQIAEGCEVLGLTRQIV